MSRIKRGADLEVVLKDFFERSVVVRRRNGRAEHKHAEHAQSSQTTCQRLRA
jgi:hypothetical protein